MTPADIAAALLRTTLATSAAALAAWALLACLRIDAPRIHRLAWLLVIAQGWFFFPLTIEIETDLPPTTTKRAAGFTPAETAERSSIPFLNEAPRCREPFATRNSPLMGALQSQKAPDTFSVAIATWLLGALGLAIVAAGRYLQVLRALPLGSPPDDPTWQAEWHAARTAAQLRRRQPVDLRITAHLGPLLHWAPWAYLILVPRPLWTTLAAPQRQAILRHELAHLRRGDLWKSLAIRVLALPQWFNPLAWLAIRRFDEAAEWACDDAAAATAAGRLTFAESLLQSAEYAAAPFPASAPAARGVLTRRIHRLVSPRFKEESKMKLLIVPALLATVAVFQIIRIESVIADEPPAAAAKALKASTDRRSGPPLSQEQMDFDRLAKEYESFARTDYVIEPPDVVSIRISYSSSDDSDPKTYPTILLNTATPRLKITNRMNAIPRRCVVGMDGRIRLSHLTSIYIAGMTVKEAQDAIQRKLQPQATKVDVWLSVANFNSKVYYVITKNAGVGDEVTRLPIPFPANGKENVAEALARVYDNSDRTLKLNALASAALTLHRPASNGVSGERVFPISWDPSAQAPTPLTNHGILPGDRIIVASAQANTLKNPGQASSPNVEESPAVPPTFADAPKPTFKDVVDLKISVVEDQADALTEFRAIQNVWCITTDNKAFQSALRAFEKNGLVKIASQEHVCCELGQKHATAMDLPTPNPKHKWKLMRSRLTKVRVRQVEDNRLEVMLRFDGKSFRHISTPVMRLGETTLLECTGGPFEYRSTQKRTYLVVTPTLLLGDQ